MWKLYLWDEEKQKDLDHMPLKKLWHLGFFSCGKHAFQHWHLLKLEHLI